MPFTFSHPAAVIPIAKITNYRLPILALSLGSCSPDFGYYTNEWIYAAKSHDFILSLVYIAPVCLIILMIISAFKKEIITLLPSLTKPLAKEHIPAFELPKVSALLLTIFAVIIGIYSHIIWDSFTHAPEKFKSWWPFIAHMIPIGDVTIPLYTVLQHASSSLGIGVILYFILKAVKRIKNEGTRETNYSKYDKKVYLFWSVLLSVSGGASIYFYGQEYPYTVEEIPHFLFINAVTGGRYVFIGIVTSLVILKMITILQYRKNKRL